MMKISIFPLPSSPGGHYIVYKEENRCLPSAISPRTMDNTGAAKDTWKFSAGQEVSPITTWTGPNNISLLNERILSAIWPKIQRYFKMWI